MSAKEYNERVDNIKLNKSHILLIAVAILLLLAMSVGRYAGSLYYLGRAEKSVASQQKLRYYLASAFFWKNNEALLGVGDIYYQDNDYMSAKKYYGRSTGADSKKGLAKAYYDSGDYREVADLLTANPDVQDEQLLVKSYLKLGKNEEARKLLEKQKLGEQLPELHYLLDPTQSMESNDPDYQRIITEENESNRTLLIANKLNDLGFPQAAYSALERARAKGILDANALMSLVQAQKTLQVDADKAQVLEELLQKDRYYPQVYRQLLELGDSSKHQEFLDMITW